MQIKMIQNSTAAAFCALFLMQASTLLWAGDASLTNESRTTLKSIAFMQPKAGVISVPLQISPVQIDAPPRRIDLLPVRTNKINHQPSVYPLRGLPADLSEYPILDLGTSDIGSAFWGVDLALDTHAKGVADTLVHVGDPTLFPDMVDTHIDFRAVEFVPRGVVYSLKRKVGLGGDEKWRYTQQNVVIKEIANGTISASFSPGGDLVLSKGFDPLDIEKAPWLNFEYILPNGSPWFVQINAKIDTDGIGQNITLLSQPLRGGGKQKLLLNLKDMLYKADIHAKGGRLKDLMIHFILEPSTTSVVDARIELGRLEFYRVQQPAQSNMLASLLVVPDHLNQINLVEVLNNRLGLTNGLTVLRGSLVSSSPGAEMELGALPEISIQADYQEKIPKLFVGEAFYLNELNGKKLSAVLDQQLFLEKQVLWQSGQSDVVFLEPLLSDGTEGLSLPMISFAPELVVGNDAYILADYIFEGDEQFPLYLTLSGIDHQGRRVKFDHLLSKGIPIKVSNIKLTNMTISFRKADSSSPPPPSLMIKNIQISTFRKTLTYRPNTSTALISIDGGSTPLDAAKVTWEALSERIEFITLGKASMQTVKSFAINQKIVGDAFLGFDIETSGSEPWFIRVKGNEKGEYFEKLFPVVRRGTLKLSNMELQGLDLMVNGGASRTKATVMLNLLNIRYSDELVLGGMVMPDEKQRNQAMYLVPHYSPLKAKFFERRSILAAEYIDQDRIKRMHEIDTSLSYREILDGGRIVKLLETFIPQGNHQLDSLANEEVSLTLAPDNLKELQTSTAAQNTMHQASSSIPSIGWLLLAATFLYVVGCRFLPVWLPPDLHPLLYGSGFWMAELAMLGAASFIIFKSGSRDAFSWGGVMLVMAYGFAVRYKIRPFLTKNWSCFAERSSAPYFILFLFLLFTCAFSLMFNMKAEAERMAVIGYFLLITGTVIEFIQFAREAPVDQANK